jgi:hypothetical protein
MIIQFYKRYYTFLKNQEQRKSLALNQIRFKSKKFQNKTESIVKARPWKISRYSKHIIFGAIVGGLWIFHTWCNVKLQWSPFNLLHDPTVLEHLAFGFDEPELLKFLIKKWM